MATVLPDAQAPWLDTPLGPRDAGIPMSLEEFDKADYALGHRYELLNGILIVTPPPLEEERGSNEYLGFMLICYREQHTKGSALDETLPEHNIAIGPHNRRCDRAIWAGLGRLPRTRGPIEDRDVPAIVIEFASSRPADMRRDYEEKPIEYREAGVQEYWIIDRFRRTLTVHLQQAQKWTKQTVTEAETYQTKLLPGFELPLAKLLAISDKYKDQ